MDARANSGKVARVSGSHPLSVRAMALIAAALAAGALFACWTLARADRELRAELLQQARLVVQGVDSRTVAALSGTAADLESPGYQKLKGQLSAVRSANPRCRFVYIMGRRADGAVFFFADSEPPDSEEYSPPGQIYDEASTEYRRVFESKTDALAGPVADRWGTWISALVPITSPQSRALIAVLGIDVDARDWKWDVVAKSAMPLGLMLLLLIGTVAVVVAARPPNILPRPIMRRLLPPLSLMVILLLTGTEVLLYRHHLQWLKDEMAADTRDVSGDLRVALAQESGGLGASACLIATDPRVPGALREGDAGSLLAIWRPMYETLHRERELTHLYFFDTNRVCILRVHAPDRRGDRIDRFTAREAERTGKTASGIELGPLGTFTLRVVQPVFEGAMLVGYVELGREIESVLRGLQVRSANDVAVVIRKDLLNRQTWNEGLRMLGRNDEWDFLPRSILVYASRGRLPDAFKDWADEAAVAHDNSRASVMIHCEGKAWRVSATHLMDASGKDVGALLLMNESAAENAAFLRLRVLSRTAGGVLLFGLLSFIYILLRRTDASMRAQQAEMRDSEAKHRLLFESAGDAMLIHDSEARILAVNPAACQRLGYTHPELMSMTVDRLCSPEEPSQGPAGPDRQQEIGHHTFSAVLRRKDASMIPTEVDARHIAWDGGPAMMLTCRDMTERKRAQEEIRWMALTLDTAPNSVMVQDFEGHFFYANQRAFELHGYPRDEFLSLTLRQIEVPVEEWVHAARMRELSERGEAFFDVVRRRKDGTTMPLEVRAKVIAWYGKEAILSVATDLTRRREMEAEALRYRTRLQELSERVVSAEEEDRWRISRYIHDTIIQNLSLSSIRLGAMGKRLSGAALGEEADVLRKIKELLNKVIDECRLVMSDLTPNLLYELGLVPALKEFAQQAKDRHGARIIVDDEEEDRPMSRGLRSLLFECVSELAMNALKHAGPCEIRIALSSRAGELQLRVTDNGKGFDADSAETQPTRQSGFGLFNIRRRLEGLGGRLEIDTAPGKGTTATITVPAAGGGAADGGPESAP
jgi:PAS domain S-box-containing protein